MRVIPQSVCRIQRTTASLRNVYCGPGHKQSIYSSAYSVHNIQLNVSALLLEISRKFNVRYTANLVPNTAHILQFTLCELWSGHIQSTYSSAYSGHNIQLNVSALLLEISRQFNARYTANIEPNTAYIIQFAQCVLWSREYAMHLQLRIFRLQYSSERICAAIADISRMLRATYCKPEANCSAHPPVYDI
jgi:hypothetical protein